MFLNVEGSMEHRRKRRQLKKIRRIIILSISGIILLGVLLFGVLFYTINVEVVGNNRYSEAQIKEMVMKGPLSWNTLLMSKLKEHINLEDIAFMESVDVEYLDRNTIRLHVSEKYPIGYVEDDGSKYYFDKDGMVLESEKKTEESQGLNPEEVQDQETLSPEVIEEETAKQFHPELTDVPVVTGLEFPSAEVGKKLEVEDPSIFNSILGLARMADKYQIQPDRVEIGEDNVLTLYYGNVRIVLGKDENLEDKMTRVAGILPKLNGESGVLHLEGFTNDTQNIIFERDS